MTQWSVKQRALVLVEALLKYIDEKPEARKQKPEVRARWVSANKLLVTGNIEGHRDQPEGTTFPDLLKLMKEYQTLKSEFDPEGKTKKEQSDNVRKVVREGIKKLEGELLLEDLRSKEIKDKSNCPYWKFELTLKGEHLSIQENLAYVAKKLKISSPQSESSNGIDWHDICSQMLEEQRRATSNHLMKDDSAKKSFEEIYVPLALVQKKKTDKRQPDDLSPDAGTSLYQPEYETKQRFEHDAFLSQILKRGEGKSQGRRIALIAEPGAGKTTLLQKIADWILKQNLGFPVWISLADLVRRENVTEIETYIFDTWLKQAYLPPKLTEEVRSDFYHQIEQGKVWLLLDGVDEMLGGNVSQPLAEIARQLTGWINYSRVVLTCRLNVWQANSNPLEFETYRLLDFDYPQQVQQFIDKWFEKDIEKGKRLKAELHQAERGRLQDLVKNPLRLSLLCSIWQEKEGNLPETKAGLYGRYRRYIYSWKEKEFPIKRKQQDELDFALAKLALRDINEGSSRFRMRERFIIEELGYSDDEDSHFDQAFKIGWLNHVGYAAESDIEEKVCAFYHATFEEYFAALAIDDWDFFLPNEHIDRPVVKEDNSEADRPYRIFEPQWKEVFLLWMGREDVDKEDKEQFVKELIEFDSGCGSFYHFDAYFLAAAGIAEFRNCSKANEIVKQIVKWSISYPVIEEQQVRFSEPLIANLANSVLLETDRIRAIAALKNLLQPQDERICLKVARILKKIDPDNPTAIAALENLSQSQDRSIKQDAESILGRTVKGPPQERSAPKTNQSQDELISLLDHSQDERILLRAAEDLLELDPDNQPAIAALENLLQSEDELVRLRAARNLVKLDPDNQPAIAALENLLQSKDELVRLRVAEDLLELDSDNQPAIEAIVDLLQPPINIYILSAKKLLPKDRMAQVINVLKDYLSNETYENNHEQFKFCHEVIWHCAQTLPYPAFYHAWYNS